MTDTQLLQRFVGSGDAEAFAEIVRRHVDVVYAAARRQANGDGELAQEITQRVFILLSQKAARLKDDVILGGWLFNSVLFVARAEMRRGRRRSNQEKKAAAMAEENRKAREPGKIAKWDDAESVLDEAMGKLDQQARGILVLRYFEGKSAREVGDRLGISEEAARKRTSRAIEQLRGLFARSGVMLSAAEVAQGLALPVMQAPAHVATSAALAATSSSAAAASATGSFLKGAIAIMAYIKTSTAVVAIISVILLGGAAVGIVEVVRSYKAPDELVVEPPEKPVPGGPTISGVVDGVDGRPIVGAKVFVATAQNEMFLPLPAPGGRGFSEPRGSATTDASGKYTVAKPAPPFAVFVVANQGYAQASWMQFETASELGTLAPGRTVVPAATLILRPWARIEGIVKAGDQPLPGGYVSLWRVQEREDPWEKLLHIEAVAKADGNGHFVFPKVPPGEVWLYKKVNPNGSGGSQWQYVQVEAGQTVNVQIGGVGVRVSGRVNVPPEIAQLVDWTNHSPHSYTATIRRTDISHNRPKHDPSETPEQYTDVELQFGRTETGKIVNETMFGADFAVNPDGTFTMDDVLPGTYDINIRNFEDQPGENFLEDVAGGNQTVVVRAMNPSTDPSANPASSVDAGTIVLKAVPHHAEPGQAAPDFVTTTLDGKTWKLADQKGKVVVLFFWATYRQDMGEDQFAAFADKWGANPNVSILGVCMSNDPSGKQIQSIAAKLNFHFPESAEGQRLMQAYDTSWPDAVLIDRSGKIVQKYLTGDSVEKAMEEAVGK